jgi:hypothetical protein
VVVACCAGVTVVVGAFVAVRGLLPHSSEAEAIAAYRKKAIAVCRRLESYPEEAALELGSFNQKYNTDKLVSGEQQALKDNHQILAVFLRQPTPRSLLDEQQALVELANKAFARYSRIYDREREILPRDATAGELDDFKRSIPSSSLDARLAQAFINLVGGSC